MLLLTRAGPNFSQWFALYVQLVVPVLSITGPAALNHLGAFNKYQYLGPTPEKLNQNFPICWASSTMSGLWAWAGYVCLSGEVEEWIGEPVLWPHLSLTTSKLKTTKPSKQANEGDAMSWRKGEWWSGEGGYGREAVLDGQSPLQGQNGHFAAEVIFEGQGKDGATSAQAGEGWISAKSRPTPGVPAPSSLQTQATLWLLLCAPCLAHTHVITAYASGCSTRFWLPCEGIHFLKCHSSLAGGLGNSQQGWPRASGGHVSTNTKCQRLIPGALGVGWFAHQRCLLERRK